MHPMGIPQEASYQYTVPRIENPGNQHEISDEITISTPNINKETSITNPRQEEEKMRQEYRRNQVESLLFPKINSVNDLIDFIKKIEDTATDDVYKKMLDMFLVLSSNNKIDLKKDTLYELNVINSGWEVFLDDMDVHFDKIMNRILNVKEKWDFLSQIVKTKIKDKFEDILLYQHFPDSYKKLKEWIDNNGSLPLEFTLFLRHMDYGDYTMQSFCDIIEFIGGDWTLNNDDEPVLPFESLQKLLESLPKGLLTAKEITSDTELQIATLHKANFLSRQDVLGFFSNSSFQNMTSVKAFMIHNNLAQIKPLDIVTEAQKRTIFRYTGHYSVNSFIREEFWNKDTTKSKEIRSSFGDDYVRRIWDQFCKDPVLTSLDEILEAASVQEALLTLAKIQKPHEADALFRSIRFDSLEQLKKAVAVYLPEGAEFDSKGSIDLTESEVPFFERGFTSTSKDLKVVENRGKGQGVNFGGEFMITFHYTGELEKGVSIQELTNRNQAEVLFSLEVMRGNVLKVTKKTEGHYLIFCEIT